jgi:ABC-type lipoprotein release transport system permease subunit
MKGSTGLAWRFARGADRRGKVLAAAGVVGIAVGVAVSLGGLSVTPAMQARDERQSRRSFISGSERDDVLLMDRGWSTFRGDDLTIFRVAPIGAAPIPPGVEEVPGPGDIVASPALAAVLHSPDRSLLSVRVPGGLVGTITDDGLVEPDELTAYVGVAPDAMPRDADRVTRFNEVNPAYESYELDPGVRAAIVASVAGVILAVLVFVWTVTRLGASSRESRLAALRLLGATPGAVRAIVALEVGITAIAGALLGSILFLFARQLVPWSVLLPGDIGLFPGDLRPPPWQAALVLLGVPIIAVAVAWVSLRRVVSEPIAVVRRSPGRSWGAAAGAIALVIGLGAWATVWIDPFDHTTVLGSRVELATRLGGWVLTALGVLGVAPWVGTKGAGALARIGGVGGWLAARRLAYDRRASGRIAAGVVTVVFAASISVGLLQLFVQDRGLTTSPANLLATTLIARVDGRTDTDAALRSVDGVTSKVWLGTLTVRRGDGARTATALVVDCAALGDVLRIAPDCGSGVALDSGAERFRGSELTLVDGHDEPVGSVVVPSSAASVDLRFMCGGLVRDRASLPPAAVEASQWFTVLLGTDGDPDVAERVREALGSQPRATVTAPSDFEAYGWSQESAIARALQWASYVALAITAATMLVALIGAVHERRRSLAILGAVGVPASSLRWTFVLQAVTPVALGASLAFACAVVVVLVYAGEFRDVSTWVAVLPGLRLSLIAVGGAVVAALLTLPSVGRSIDPSVLQTE